MKIEVNTNSQIDNKLKCEIVRLNKYPLRKQFVNIIYCLQTSCLSKMASTDLLIKGYCYFFLK